MTILKRFLYYGAGFTAGMFLLFFFLGGKKTSCDYGPNARVLKNIRIKQRVFSQGTLATLKKNSLDTASISYVLQKGDVDFSKSKTDLDSCKTYWINGIIAKKKMAMHVVNCKNQATIQKISITK